MLAIAATLVFFILRRWRRIDRWRRKRHAYSGMSTHIDPGAAYNPKRFQPKPPWVTREVLRLKALMPDDGCRKIADAR